MSSTFNFHGQTTFIDQPKDVVIKNFQNQFVSGDSHQTDHINEQFIRLIELILNSEQVQAGDKKHSIETLHNLAAEVKSEKVNKLTFKATLNSIKEIVTKSSDIATPALSIIKTILSFFG